MTPEKNASVVKDWLCPSPNDLILEVKPNGPMATLEAARDHIRAMPIAKREAQPIRVMVAAGCYEMAKPFSLGALDSGTPYAPIIYQAMPATRPMLSGGKRLDAWSETKVDGHRVWSVTLDEVCRGEWWFTQLFVDGRRAPRARWPKHGFFELYDLSPEPSCVEAGFAPGELRAWNDLDDVELVAPHFWVESHLAIAAVDETAGRVRFKHPAIRRLNDERCLGRCRYAVENAGDTLSEPGEWQLNARTGILRYLPRVEERLEQTVIIAPRLATLIELHGTPAASGTPLFSDPGKPAPIIDFPPDRPGMRKHMEELSAQTVHDVHLVGFDLRHTEWQYAAGNPGDPQSATTVPGAVLMTHCRDCSLRLNRLSNLGGYGIELGVGVHQTVLVANRLDDLGGGGIKLGHGSHFNTLCDNTLTRGGRRFASAVGIWIGHSGDNVVCHNRIDDFFYTGISVGWVWGYRPSQARRNLIERNVVTRIGQGILSDMGGIYSLGVSPGTVVRGNVFRNVRCFSYGGSGLYPDEGSAYILYEDNVVSDMGTGCISMNYGRDCVFRNNLLFDGGDKQVRWGTPRQFRPMRLDGNVIVFGDGEAVDGNWFVEPALVEFERNLWYRRNGLPVTFSGESWQDWTRRGFDVEGLCTDPLLSAESTGQPALRADSPALRLGFKPIDISDAGPRSSVLTTGTASVSERNIGPLVWVQIELAEPLPQDAPYEDRFTRSPECTPCTLRLKAVVENAGDAPFTGTVRLDVDGLSDGLIKSEGKEGVRTERLELPPGGHMALPLTITVAAGVDEVIVRASGDESVWGTVLGLGFRPVVQTPRLPAHLTAKDIERELKDCGAEPHEIIHGRHRLATVRIGVCGDDLVLFADVNDDAISLGVPVFSGSMIDLFAMASGVKTITGQATETRGQLFLIPGTQTKPARLTDVTNSITAGDDLHFYLRPGGYCLAARIPMARLNIKIVDGEFGFTVAVYTHVDGVAGVLRSRLFNQRSLSDSHAYARMCVEDETQRKVRS